MHKWYIKNESSNDKEGSIEELNGWGVNDGGEDQITPHEEGNDW